MCSDGEVSLHLEAYQQGEIVDFVVGPDESKNSTFEILRFSDPTAADYGAANRAALLLDAVCRYFNTGGSWEVLHHLLKRAELAIPGGLVFPGYIYLEGNGPEGVYQHVFGRIGSDEAILWSEHEFIDRTTKEQIRKQQEETGWA